MALFEMQPDLIAAQVEALTPSALEKLGMRKMDADNHAFGVRAVVFDGMGTLFPHNSHELDESVVEMIRNLGEAGITAAIMDRSPNIEDIVAVEKLHSVSVITPSDAKSHPIQHRLEKATMISMAASLAHVKPSQMLTVGDRLTDMAAANVVGAKKMLVAKRGGGEDWRVKYSLQRELEMIARLSMRLPLKMSDYPKELTRLGGLKPDGDGYYEIVT